MVNRQQASNTRRLKGGRRKERRGERKKRREGKREKRKKACNPKNNNKLLKISTWFAVLPTNIPDFISTIIVGHPFKNGKQTL